MPAGAAGLRVARERIGRDFCRSLHPRAARVRISRDISRSLHPGAARSRITCKVYGTLMDARDDADLMGEVAMGSEEALEALFHRHGGSVLAFARRMLDDREEAEEVLQDTFLRLHRNAGVYDGRKAALRTWLYAIARNLCLSRLRARRSRPSKVDALDPHAPGFNLGAAPPTDLLSAVVVRRALAGLAADERDLLEGAFFDGYSHHELAALHGLPLGTVKSKLRRALLRLRADIGEDVL